MHIGRHTLTLQQQGQKRRIPLSEILFIDGRAGTVVLRSREWISFGEAYSKPSQRWLAALPKASCLTKQPADQPAVPEALQQHSTAQHTLRCRSSAGESDRVRLSGQGSQGR